MRHLLDIDRRRADALTFPQFLTLYKHLLSVIPALGEKLQSASKRFNIIENNMRKKNKNFQLDMLSGSRAEMQDIDSSAMNECTPKGVEIKTMRFLIRTHLEEQRMMHTERAAAILLEQQR